MILGHPALAWLARAKLRGTLRKQSRRLRTPAGALLGLLGLAVVVLWLAPLFLSSFTHVAKTAPASRTMVELALAMLALLSLSNSLSHRGLYVPLSEIERLFAAPISRSDLIRHRVVAALGRSLFGSLVLGLIAARHATVPAYGFVGGVAVTLMLPILSQGVSLLAGDAENRLAARMARLPRGWFAWLLTLLLAGGVAAMYVRNKRYGRWMDASLERALGFDPMQVLEHPLVRALFAPLQPWSRMITAVDAAGFFTWLGVSGLITVAGFELVARIRVDFRELSLSTAADVAKRLQRMRRGAAGAGSASASRASAGWYVPWLFGRGPLGAIAWRKTASMVRKSRATLVIGVLVVAAVTAMSLFVAANKPQSALFGSLLIAGLGTPYLCGALRFDFREDLDSMGVIKAWPMQPWRIFIATLTPQILVVSLLLLCGIAARAAISRDLPPLLPLWPLLTPLLVTAWLAIDNAAFLFSPVRIVPGQEGVLQNAGRAMLLLLARLLAFAGVVAIVLIPLAAAQLLQMLIEFEDSVLIAVGLGAGTLALIATLVALIWIGGWLLRRFDVARDRA